VLAALNWRTACFPCLDKQKAIPTKERGVPCQWREADDIVMRPTGRVGDGLARLYVFPLQLLTGVFGID
jgi:hypothetical protein